MDDVRPTDTAEPQEPAGILRWSEWDCTTQGNDEACAAAWPTLGAGAEAGIQCYDGVLCEMGDGRETTVCEGTVGTGCSMCENAFRDCFTPWYRGL